jgi:hypothetical protein
MSCTLVKTNEEGIYNIPNLPPGTYRAVVQKFAFRTIVKPDIEFTRGKM